MPLLAPLYLCFYGCALRSWTLSWQRKSNLLSFVGTIRVILQRVLPLHKTKILAKHWVDSLLIRSKVQGLWLASADQGLDVARQDPRRIEWQRATPSPTSPELHHQRQLVSVPLQALFVLNNVITSSLLFSTEPSVSGDFRVYVLVLHRSSAASFRVPIYRHPIHLPTPAQRAPPCDTPLR